MGCSHTASISYVLQFELYWTSVKMFSDLLKKVSFHGKLKCLCAFCCDLGMWD